MRLKSGTRNQKIVSLEPSRRSFLVKSTADSVALPPQPNSPLDVDLVGATLEMVNEAARKVKARMSKGSDDLRHKSKDSAKVMKIPILCEL